MQVLPPSNLARNAEGLSSVPLSVWDVVMVGGQALPGIAKVTGPGRKRKHDKKNQPGSDGGNMTDLGALPADFDIDLEIWTVEQLNTLTAMLPTLFPVPTKPPPVYSSYAAEGISPLSNPVVTPNPDLANIPGVDTSAFNPIGPGSAVSNAGELDILTSVVQPTAVTSMQPAPTMVPFKVSHPAFTMLNVKSVYFMEQGVPTAEDGVIKMKLKVREYLPPSSKNVTSTATGAVDLTTLDSAPPPTPPTPPSSTDLGP